MYSDMIILYLLDNALFLNHNVLKRVISMNMC